MVEIPKPRREISTKLMSNDRPSGRLPPPIRFAGVALASIGIIAAAFAETAPTKAQQIAVLLNSSERDIDFAEAKLAIDEIVDPTIDAEAARVELDQLTAAARVLAGQNPTSAQKIAAVRKVIYEPGPWNGNRPFSYDLADPLGRDSRHKLISTYLRTRKGNCVSMPVLFLILADRLGADVTLSSAPLHIFVKWTDETGRVMNLETTSGGHPARDVWIRQQEPFTDEAIANGIYLQKMSRREAIAHLANLAVDQQIATGDYEGAISTANAILDVNPKDVYAMVKTGSAYGHLLRTRFYEVYPSPADIPAEEIAAYQYSAKMNAELFERAEALGWRPVQ